MTTTNNRGHPSPPASVWTDNRSAWQEYLSGMAADWSAFAATESATVETLADEELAGFSAAVWGWGR